VSGKPPSQLIDARIRELADWRGDMLGRLRALVKRADPEIVEEWKWSVPVWSRDGIVCTGEVNEKALKALVRAAVALNKASTKS